MKQRIQPLVGALGFLLALSTPSYAQELESRQVWVAAGGEARLELRADLLADFGVEVVDDGLVVHEVVETRRRLGGDDHLALAAPYGNFERFLSGRISLDTGWLLRHRDREARLDGLTLTPGIYSNGHPSLEVRDRAGRHLLTLTHLHIVAEHERGLLTIHNADVVATPALGERLGVEALAELPIGRAWFDLPLQIPDGADTSGLGPDCDDRPLWPQEGEQVDVGLIGMGTVAYQGTDPASGRVKVAPSATLKNMSQGDVPWIPKFSELGPPHEYPYDPPDQHPFLVWNMYRIVDGRIEQLADSGVKHAFVTLNQNCDINCGNGNVLWPGCEDVYSSGTNDSNFNLGPRTDIQASEGLFFSTCSFFDPGCTGSQTNNSGEYENRLLVDPDELQTPGADYFFDSWYVIQYDTDIWNSMGYHPITPTPAGDGWTFNPGPFTVGRALDEWVDPDTPGPNAGYAEVVVPSATPDEPYPDNMPQGHINVLVRVTEPEPGHFRYNYAVQNFDFDRGVEAFRIPLPAGAQVFETYFGDVDDDAGNDWTVTVDGGFVSFEATADHPLPWFTLFNFEIEVDTPPAASQVTLALGGDAVVPSIDAAILGPSVGGGETHVVTVQNFEFVPAELTINVGDTVEWSNVEGSHNVVADDDSFTSGPAAPAPWTYSFTFEDVGTNPYYCEPHGGPGGAGMSGVITVVGQSGPALGFDPSGLAFGDIEVGTTSPPQIVTLSNTGDADATGLTFSGLPDGGFEADTSDCGTTLPAGGSCEVSVTFTPQVPGAAAATLHVEGDEGAAADLELSGNGVGDGGPFPEIELQEVVSGLTSPVGIANARDGSDRLFVVQQTGEIRIVSDGELLPTPFLDLSALVSCCSERGLLGLAFHPDYAANGFFYVDYTNLAGDTVVARYEVSADDPDQADPDSAQTVLTQGQPFSNHNGGNIVFGPDGYLYVGLGDGGSGGDPEDNGQDLETWLGKLLRIDVDGDDFPDDADRNYAVPPDNPFVGAPGLDEIWAYGVRNPWRFTFDRVTGDLWIGDVGQGAWEEIDLQPAASGGGENYGWDVLEAAHCFEDDPGGDGSCDDFLNGGSDLPILEYDHSLGCSVSGGYRYRGQLEVPLAGIYFYSDLCSGRIWGARPAGGGTWETEELFQAPFSVTTFGEDEAGELYVAEYTSAVGQAKLHRIVTPGAGAPVLAFDPATLDFGEVPVGTTSAPQTATLSNTGDADATGLTFTVLPDAGFEADTSDCGDTLPAGESCAVSVTFSPLAPGPVTATLNADSAEGADATMGLSGVGVEAEGPIADVSPDAFELTLEEGEVGTDVLTVGNLGGLDLEWSITTDEPESAAIRFLDHDPALDEPLDVPDFVIDSLPNDGEPVEFTIPAGVLTQGDVVGFSFVGTVSGISDSSSWASDMCMTLEAPDGTTYVVGGFSGVSLPGCYNAASEEGNPWDFQGLPSDEDGTYDSFHDDVFPGVGDEGDWTLTFVNDWDNTGAATHTWTDVTVTLYKQAPGLCGDVTDIPWLSADPDSGTTEPGATDEVTVTFDSTAAGVGTHEAALCVATNDPDAPVVPVPVTLTVVEGGEPVLSFDPSSLDFGDVEVGTASPPQTAMLHNTGDADATGVTFSGLPDAGFEADTSACGDTLPAGGSCAVTVTFTPAAPGPATATLHADSDEGAAADLGLSGNGVEGGEPVLSFDLSSLDFGDVEVGTTSPPQTAMLHNTGDAEATGLTFSGLPDSGFEADTSACGDTLPVGASCAISVTFTPLAPGPAAATLHVASDEGATADLDLSGNGVEDGEPPVIDVDPDSLGSTLPEGGTETQPLTIANLGDETLAWEVTEDGAAGARLAPSAAHRSSGAASGARAGRTSRTVVTVNEQGVFEAVDVIGSADGAATSFAPAPVAGPAGLAHAFPQGTTLWSYDDEDAIADGVAIDDIEAWGAWHLTGSRLSAHAILGDGTPDFEFSSFGSGSSGVASAKGADRIVFIEGNDTSDQYRVHGFTSQSGGAPDWTFELPPTMTGLLVNFRHVAVSYDGSIAAAIGRDTPAEESTLYVFDAETGEVTFTWTDSTFMAGVDLTDDGSIALVTQTNLATVVDTVTGEILFQTAGSGGGSIYYRISGDGNVLVIGGFDLDVYQFDGTTYQPVIEFTRPTSWFGQASVVSRDGSTVGALAQDHGAAFLETEAYLFDVASGELLGSQLFTGSGAFTGVAADAASSDDGSVMAFASWGTEFHDWPEVMVFNRDVELLGAIEFPGSAFSVDVSADGQYVVGGSKAVHANVFGNGGRIELIAVEVGEPGDCVLPEWVSVDPTSGSVPADGEQVVDVTFDAGELEPGDYEANLCLANNDPVSPLVVVPLNLTVEGEAEGPVADITPDAFAFEVPQGGSDTDTLNVGNIGDADLTWSIDEAGTELVLEGAPYAYGLAGAPELHAPVGYDRASGITRSRGEAPADPIVLPAPQPAAIGELDEGFDDITQLPGAGWAMINNSEPTGPSSWFQGNDSIFPSHEGVPDAYIAANFESTDDAGDISNWLLTPEVTIVNGTTACFWTRTSEQFEEFYDRLEVRMSIAGDSTDVGDTAESVGDFTDLLLSINPDLMPGEYPEEWTEFCVTVRERSRQPVTGRFAFRYWVTDSGPDGTNGDYIGIDTVSVTQPDDIPPGGCDNPADIPWLAADPTSGTTAPGGSETVNVTVDATDLEVGEHTALLCVTTNDPSAPQVEIPVQLTVTGAGTVLFDNGPIVTHPGAGPDGTDHSTLQNISLGMGLLGVFVSLPTYRIADDFEVSEPWDVDTFSFFVYQTGSDTTSTITAVNYRIWDGSPDDPGSSVVFGDTTTNRLMSTEFSDVYRVSESLVNTDRPVMEVVAEGNFSLEPGTYWVDAQFDGSLASGPFMPPVTILGETETGDALQEANDVWYLIVDSGSQGMPFIIQGSTGLTVFAPKLASRNP